MLQRHGFLITDPAATPTAGGQRCFLVLRAQVAHRVSLPPLRVFLETLVPLAPLEQE